MFYCVKLYFRRLTFSIPCVANSLKDVQKRSENVNTDEDPSGWRPYYTFVEHMREKYVKNEGLQGMSFHIHRSFSSCIFFFNINGFCLSSIFVKCAYAYLRT